MQAQQAAQAAEFQAQQAAQADLHRRQLEAMAQHSLRQMQDVAGYFQSLQIPGVTMPPLPTSLYAPPPLPVVPSPVGTPVSIYMVVYCYSLCGHPAGTNEIASPLHRYSRRLRTRLLQVALLHSTGCRLARVHTTRGQVAFLLCLRSRGPPGLQAALRHRGGRSRRHHRSRGGIRGKVGALHTLGTARRLSDAYVSYVRIMLDLSWMLDMHVGFVIYVGLVLICYARWLDL
jgi:hypothetical protein